MKPDRIKAIAGKEWIQITRDKRSLILSLLTPLLLVLLFGYALTSDVKHIKTAVLDYDRTAESRSLTEKFSHSEYFSIVKFMEKSDESEKLFNRGEASIVLVIPEKFGEKLKSGKGSDLQIIIDGSDSTAANISLSYLKGIITQFNFDLLKSKLAAYGNSSFRLPVNLETRVWYNETLESRFFIIPGTLVLILAIISALITSLTMSREWERGTMETLLTTPIRPHEAVIGKLIPYLMIGIFDVTICTLFGYFLFGVTVKGNFALLALLAILFLLGTSSLGMAISSVTRLQVLSIQIALMATYLPTLILSGFMFPIQNMPHAVQVITYIIPAKYMIAISRGIMLKGVGFTMLTTQIIFLSIFSAATFTIAIKKFRTRLS